MLEDLGLKKNTEKVTTPEGRSIPDALTNTESIEIKDAARVSNTKQLQIQAKAARQSGRKSILITGEKTHVSGCHIGLLSKPFLRGNRTKIEMLVDTIDAQIEDLRTSHPWSGVRSMYMSPVCGVIAGIVLLNAMHLSCTPEQVEHKWAMDVILKDEFVIYTSVDAIPKPIINSFAFNYGESALANPGEVYNSTDVIIYHNRPTRRLIFAGQSGNHWFVYFEDQGCRLHLFEHTDMQTVPKFKINIIHKFNQFDELRQFIIKSSEMTIYNQFGLLRDN